MDVRVLCSLMNFEPHFRELILTFIYVFSKEIGFTELKMAALVSCNKITSDPYSTYSCHVIIWSYELFHMYFTLLMVQLLLELWADDNVALGRQIYWAVKAFLTLGAFAMYLHGLLASFFIAGCTGGTVVTSFLGGPVVTCLQLVVEFVKIRWGSQ